MRVAVTHVGWISFIKDEKVWESTAFDPVGDAYQKCDPIVPEKREPSSDVAEVDYTAGFYAMNSFMKIGYDLASICPLFIMPAYEPNSYVPVNKITNKDGITEDKLRPWIGKPLIYKEKGSGKELNTLTPDFSMLSYDGLWISGLEWIGLSALNPKKTVHKQFDSYI